LIVFDEYSPHPLESYSEYFSKSANIEEDYLFNKSGDVSYVATLMITLELYLNQINKFFEDVKQTNKNKQEY